MIENDIHDWVHPVFHPLRFITTSLLASLYLKLFVMLDAILTSKYIFILSSKCLATHLAGIVPINQKPPIYATICSIVWKRFMSSNDRLKA